MITKPPNLIKCLWIIIRSTIVLKKIESHCTGFPSVNLQERVKGRACNSPLSRRASVGGWTRGGGGFLRQWRKGLEGQWYEVKRGPQHFHDFPRLIVMHGAHPDRLAFKLRHRLPLSSSRTLLSSSLSRLTSISFFSLVKRHRATPSRCLTFFSRAAPLARDSSSSSFSSSPSFFFHFSSQQRDKNAHVLQHPRKGWLLGGTDTGWVTGQLSLKISPATEIPKPRNIIEILSTISLQLLFMSIDQHLQLE